MIEFPLTPITEKTFESQEWEMVVEKDGQDEEGRDIEYYYWRLPLPKDNPDENAFCFISSANDDYEDLNIKKGEYYVEIENMLGLGICTSEEELEILYRALTKEELNDNVSV